MSKPPTVVGAGLRSHRLALAAAVALVVAAAVQGGLVGRTARLIGRSPAAAASVPPAFGVPEAVEVDDPALNDMGDPYVVAVGAGTGGLAAPGYAVFWTTDWTANVPVAVSTDLVHWRRVADALPVLPQWARVVEPPPSWSAPAGVSTMTWGPTVHRIGPHWVLYYSTEDARSGRECIGAASGSGAVGPYVDGSAGPLMCQTDLGGDIDPSVVVTSPGRLALVWKNDGNATGRPVSIWEAPLAPDGLSVVGRPARLIGPGQAWEHGIVEGPAMLKDPHGGWWLFYSGGTWQSDTYDTGVAWCTSPSGPCRKPFTSPVLASTPTAVSPGGLDTFVDHHGRLWASYSAFPTAPADARAAMASPRVLELARILGR